MLQLQQNRPRLNLTFSPHPLQPQAHVPFPDHLVRPHLLHLTRPSSHPFSVPTLLITIATLLSHLRLQITRLLLLLLLTRLHWSHRLRLIRLAQTRHLPPRLQCRLSQPPTPRLILILILLPRPPPLLPPLPRRRPSFFGMGLAE